MWRRRNTIGFTISVPLIPIGISVGFNSRGAIAIGIGRRRALAE